MTEDRIQLETKYYYTIHVHLMTLGEGKKQYSHIETFDKGTLPEMRTKALKFYADQCEGILSKGDFYGKEFASFKNHDGSNAVFSVCMNLVEFNGYETYEYETEGPNLEEQEETHENEKAIFKEFGFDLSRDLK